MNSLCMQGEGLFTHSRFPDVAAAYLKGSRSKIQDLILRHPTDYSQSRAAARIMLEAYGSKDTGKLTAEEYEWSEIFHVARRESRSFLFADSAKSGVSHFSGPEFPSMACFSVYEVQPTSRRLLKLPQIDTEGTRIDGTRQIYDFRSINKPTDGQNISSSGTMNMLHGLQSREVFSDDTENTGLVIKLPEIVNDIVRVAQKS